MKKYKLKDIIDLQHNMTILVDKEVELDGNGDYLVNVGYIRVSTDKQAESGFGLDIQTNDISDYCRKNDVTNLLLFTDDGYTGTNMNRPALQHIIEMIDDYNTGRSNIRINSMIVPRIDRLGRTLLGTLQFIQDYIVASSESKNSKVNKNKEDINFISIKENYCRIERNNPQGKFLLMLFASLAEFDRDLIVEKLKKGMIERVSVGKWMGGGNVPYGYKYDKEQGILVVVPEEAQKVKEIFRLYVHEKMSPNKIADLLGFKGDKIVTQILNRKSLTGCIIYKGQEYKGSHEAIIPLNEWEEAQEEMESRRVVRGETSYLLSGLLVCGECGAKMRYQKWDQKTGECKLVCYSRQKSKPYLVRDENCKNKLYWQSDVEQAVIDELFKMSYLGDESKQKKEAFINPIESLNQQLSAERRKLSRLYEFDDDDSDDVLKEKIDCYREKIRNLEAQITSENEQMRIQRRIGKAKSLLKNLKDTWPEMSQKERQTVCRELIDKVVVYKNDTIDVKLKLNSFLSSKQ